MRFTMRVAAVVALLGLLVAGAGAEDREVRKDKAKDIDDATFVKMAAMSNLKEVKMSEVATDKATSTEVKRFAQRMVKDHTKSLKDLRAAAKDARVDVPEKLVGKDKPTDLGTGKGFDARYMKMQVDAHVKSVELYERASRSVKSAELRKYAEQTLPVIREHLKMAKEVSSKLGGKD